MILRVLCLIVLFLILGSCTTVQNSDPGNNMNILNPRNKDVIIISPAWTTEREKETQLITEIKRKASVRCGVTGYDVTDLLSYRWNEHTFLSPPYNFIEANFVCLNKKNNSDGIVKAEEDDSDDKQSPTITASSRRDTETNAVIVGKVTDNFDVAEVTINGEPVRLSSSGSFETSFYVPRSGKTIEIVAFDSKGNKATKSIKLERGAIQQATGPVFANLNPSGKRVSQSKDALALIIGVSDYERTPAKAAYADKDAQTFYDYAMLKLGIPASNIKELVNTNADRVDVRLAIKDWIARTTKKGRSDVYVFFAGHGLADQTGKEMYLLPHDGEPRLLEDTAISRERLFSDIAAANPRSVTVFLDTCYSGTTRGTDMLVASRPIAIRAKQQNIPDGFTVFTAAGGDQTAKPLEEAKHGMFSYFLMKGMEGDADSNRDNQITAAELHEYVVQNVVQQSGGSQVPELQGDAERVLVRFQ